MCGVGLWQRDAAAPVSSGGELSWLGRVAHLWRGLCAWLANVRPGPGRQGREADAPLSRTAGVWHLGRVVCRLAGAYQSAWDSSVWCMSTRSMVTLQDYFSSPNIRGNRLWLEHVVGAPACTPEAPHICHAAQVTAVVGLRLTQQQGQEKACAAKCLVPHARVHARSASSTRTHSHTHTLTPTPTHSQPQDHAPQSP